MLRISILILVGAAFIFPMPALASDDAAISKGGGVSLTADAYRTFAQHIMTDEDRSRFINNPDVLREFVLDYHSDYVLAQEAESAGLEEDPKVATRIARARRQILIDALMARAVEDIEYPDFEQLSKERYDADPSAYRIPERRKAAHILIRVSRSCGKCVSAEDVLQRFRAGEDFSALAAEVSDDPGSFQNGGLIDLWVERDGKRFVESFEDALFALDAVGDISDPVPTRFGTHVIRLAAIEKARIPPYEEVKAGIVDSLRKQFRHSILSEKRSASYPDPRTLDLDALKALIESVN